MNPSAYINLYVFPTGRRIFAHTQVRERALSHGLERIAEHAERAIIHDRQALRVELERRSSPQSRFSPEASRLDGLMDRAVSGLEIFLKSQVRVYGEQSDIGQAAIAVRQTVFPDGAGAITSLPFVQEDEAVLVVLDRLAQDDMQPYLDHLTGFADMVAATRGQHAAYHAALSKELKVPTSAELRDLQLRGQDMLCGTVVLILALDVIDSDMRAIARELMAPIERQARDIRESRRRRRVPQDIDPDTGEPTGEADIRVPDNEPA
ncbi:MAG: hypothetical protein AAGC55_22385 [Myxococcota bacterium]